MKLRSAALVAATAALVAAGSLPAAEESPVAAATGAPTIPLLTVGDTLALTTLDISKLTPVCDAYGALEGLLTVGTEGQPVPLLAQSWSTPNPTTYVFHLRHNVDFWDGDPMTSTDVVNALNYYRRPTSLVASGYRSVTSVKAAARTPSLSLWPGPMHPSCPRSHGSPTYLRRSSSKYMAPRWGTRAF